MTSMLGITVPKAGATTPPPHAPHAVTKENPNRLTSPKNLALGGLAATFLVGGGVLGALRGNPLAGLGIGAGLAAATVGAALLGNASSSQRDGYCDYYGDPDCDYPGTYTPRYEPPYHDPYYPPDYDYPRNDYPRNDYPRNDYPDPGYPYGGTSPGDDY